MNIRQSEQPFAPITITLESRDELSYLYILSNTSRTQFEKNASELNVGRVSAETFESVGQVLFNTLDELVQSR